MGPGGQQEGALVQLEVQVALVLDVDVVVDDRREGDVLLVVGFKCFNRVFGLDLFFTLRKLWKVKRCLTVSRDGNFQA